MKTITYELADKLTAAAYNNGGATFTLDGKEVTNGYCIGGGIIADGDALYRIDATQYPRAVAGQIFMVLKAYRNKLQEFDAVGIWLSDGIIYLDAVTIESDFIRAVVKGLSRQQQAIGQLDKGTYIEHQLHS